jgi:hypothetical protein
VWVVLGVFFFVFVFFFVCVFFFFFFFCVVFLGFFVFWFFCYCFGGGWWCRAPRPAGRKFGMALNLFDRRALLFLPASNPRAIARARSSDADLVILDLEDAVKPADKAEARRAAVAAITQDWPMPVAIRINGVGTPEHEADLAALAHANCDLVVLPSVRSCAVGLWVRTASAHEPRPSMGAAHLLEHLVFKGTERRTAKAIAHELEARGGSLDAYTGRDHTNFQAHILDADLPAAVDVLSDLVRRPLLRESDLQLERKVVLEEIGMVE